MRKKYDSSEIVGMLRAWKVSVDAEVLRAWREAEVNVDHIGE